MLSYVSTLKLLNVCFVISVPGKPDTYDSDSSSSTGLLVGSVVGGVVFLIIITVLIIACKVAQQRRLAMPQTPYVVQTTAGMTYKICCSYNFYLV
jgi:hypothetical protein